MYRLKWHNKHKISMNSVGDGTVGMILCVRWVVQTIVTIRYETYELKCGFGLRHGV